MHPFLSDASRVTAFPARRCSLLRRAAVILSTLLLALSTESASAQTWTTVAIEDQTVAVSGTQVARFGYGNNWVQQSVTGSLTCSQSTFGSDPAPGSFKQCDLQGSGLPATSTTMASSPNPSTAGAPITLSASVSAMSGAVPGGQVTFRNVSSSGETSTTAALVGSGSTRTASTTGTWCGDGSYCMFVAAYSGDSANAPSLSPTITQQSSASTATGTWIKIADEGNPFSVSGTQTVRFGAGANWVQRLVTGGGSCDRTFFGSDPAEGTYKECDLLYVASTTESLLVNSSFELPTVGAGNYAYGASGGTWIFDSAGVTGNGSGFTYQNSNAPDGAQVAFIQYAGTAAQTLSLAAGTYSLTMQGAQRGGDYYAASTQVIRVSVDGTPIGDYTPPRGAYGNSPAYTFSVTAGSHTLQLAGVGSGPDYTAFIDDVVLVKTNAVSALPSPPISPAPVVNYEYDAQGNPTKTIQAPAVAGYNYATQSSYDTLNRATTLTDARSKTTQIAYDGLDRPVQVTDPRSLVTQTPRNGLGDTTAVVSPDTGTATSTYDAAGNLKTRQDSRGVLATYGYDPLNRLQSVDYTGLNLPTQSFGWAYDETGAGFAYGVGRLTSTIHPNGSTQYAYDPHGRLTVDTQRVNAATGANAATVTTTVGYDYDAGGHVTSITYPSGRVVSVAYTGGLPSAIALAANAEAAPVLLLDQIQFAPFGPVTSWEWQMASSTEASNRTYDLNGRPVRYSLAGVVRDLTYDPAGRITNYTHYDAAAGAATTASTALDQSFDYDELGRLTTINAAMSNWTIGYDDNGNRTGVTLNGSTSTYNTSATSNRLVGITSPARNFGYDNAGNTTSDDGLGYTSAYDLSGRLTTLTRAGATVSFSYDGAGRRTRKFVSAGTGAGAATTVIFVYGQDGQVLGEYDQAGNALREYVWLGSTPVAVFVPDASNAGNPPVAYFVHTDHLDTPRVVIDRNNVVRWRWMAEPFGTTAPETNPSSLGSFTQNLRFPGQYAGQETGLSYNYFRDYDGSRGGYVQSDIIGLGGGINTYTYVDGNPLSSVDSMGLMGNGSGAGSGGWYSSSSTGTPLSASSIPLRAPDYGVISVPTLLPGLGISITLDRAGNVYVGPSVGFNLPGASGRAAGIGWTGDQCTPTPDQLRNFLGGWSVNAGVGLGATWSSPFSPVVTILTDWVLIYRHPAPV